MGSVILRAFLAETSVTVPLIALHELLMQGEYGGKTEIQLLADQVHMAVLHSISGCRNKRKPLPGWKRW
ncbi:MAG: hypothetical protein IJ480_03375 [Clostridia bacterium]|nr:hypothetical protein [Clostridia bacterium]